MIGQTFRTNIVLHEPTMPSAVWRSPESIEFPVTYWYQTDGRCNWAVSTARDIRVNWYDHTELVRSDSDRWDQLCEHFEIDIEEGVVNHVNAA